MPMPSDVFTMVEVLEAQHSGLAEEIADFFTTIHCLAGNAGRSWVWARLAACVRQRTRKRLKEHAQIS